MLAIMIFSNGTAIKRPFDVLQDEVTIQKLEPITVDPIDAHTVDEFIRANDKVPVVPVTFKFVEIVRIVNHDMKPTQERFAIYREQTDTRIENNRYTPGNTPFPPEDIGTFRRQ